MPEIDGGADRIGSERQQLIPEPQFISWGSIRQGIPLHRTNNTPWRQARSDRRGLPPLGLDAGVGRSGSIRFHRASEEEVWPWTLRNRRSKLTRRAQQNRFCYSF